MALIKCIECSKEISDKASTCPHCGCPISEMSTVGIVKIKLPRTQQISGGWVGLFSSKEASISSNGKILWKGKHGETATFNVDNTIPITIDLGTWCNPIKGFVSPRKKYELVEDYGIHLFATFRLSEVDMIDSGI